ncbi:tyrosine-type recombinase/integrase [Lysinibacillus xylanilyticus]|uniref:tyrosine-type recombinase/integrase n=1 Tax=Lysinibacillus xylanilyticus TaxID=582475 RepID=UPI003D96CE72
MIKIKCTFKKNGEINYWFRYYAGLIDLKHTTFRGFKTEDEAMEAIIFLNKHKRNGTLTKNLLKSVSNRGINTQSFEHFANLWLQEYRNTVESSTFRKTKGLVKNHLLPYFGNKAIKSIDVDTCQIFFNQLLSEFPSLNETKSYAKNIFEFAVGRNVLSKNPMKFVLKRKYKKKIIQGEEDYFKGNFYTINELHKFLKCAEEIKVANSKMKFTFFYLLGFTGMRKGEAFALQWSDINFEENKINITKALSYSSEEKLYVKEPKSGISRFIIIEDDIVEILKEWKQEQKAILVKRGQKHFNQTQLVFMNKFNKHINPSRSNNWIKKIQTTFGLKLITTHGLRHSHCSHCFESGMGIRDVMNKLGHINVHTTMNVYDWVTTESKEEANKKFVEYKNKHRAA